MYGLILVELVNTLTYRLIITFQCFLDVEGTFTGSHVTQ